MTVLPAPSAVLVVLDGWGLAPPGPGFRLSRRVAGIRRVERSAENVSSFREKKRTVGSPEAAVCDPGSCGCESATYSRRTSSPEIPNSSPPTIALLLAS